MTKKIGLLFFYLALMAASGLLHAEEPQPRRYICLTMIVKNESKIIERLLTSVKDIVDCVSICDTGSDDATVELIQNFLKTHNLPGQVHYHPWKNFGYNRTMSVQLAKNTLENLGFPLSETYLLLLDADMLLEIHPDFNRQHLVADSYKLTQKTGTFSYDYTRLIRASLPWKSVGVTHEYWDSAQAKNHGRLHTLSIEDRCDGGCKSDKFERDIRLLTQGLLDEPDNARYMFYLAQCYRETTQYDKAIEWYKKRIEKGGWFEEVWHSKCMIGDMYAGSK